MSIRILVELKERGGDKLLVEQCTSLFTYTLKENELSHQLKLGEVYFLKLETDEEETKVGQPIYNLLEIVEVKSTTGEIISDLNTLYKCEHLFYCLDFIEFGMKRNKWYSFEESEAGKCLKELQAEGIELTDEEEKLKRLVSQKEDVIIKEKIIELDYFLNELYLHTKRSKWDEGIYLKCEERLSWLKEKDVSIEERQEKLVHLKESIMEDPVYLRREHDRLNRLMQRYIEKIEDSILDGGFNQYAWKSITKLKEELETFKIYENYHDKLMELEKTRKEVKLKTFIPIFTTKQADEIRRIKDYPLRGILEDKKTRITGKVEGEIKDNLALAKADKEENFPQFCLELVKREPRVVAFLENPTLESCLLAISKDISIMQHIEQTPELAMRALELNPEAIKYFKL